MQNRIGYCLLRIYNLSSGDRVNVPKFTGSEVLKVAVSPNIDSVVLDFFSW